MNNITEDMRKKYKDGRKLSKEDWAYLYTLTETVYPFLVNRIETFVHEWGEENVQAEYSIVNYPPRLIIFADFSGRHKQKMMEDFGLMVGMFCTKFNMLSWCVPGIAPHGWSERKNYILKKDIEKEMEIKDRYESNR